MEAPGVEAPFALERDKPTIVLVGADGGVAVPDAVFSAIETLLPGGMGRFLELWAAPAQCRPGWTHVSERRADQSSV